MQGAVPRECKRHSEVAGESQQGLSHIKKSSHNNGTTSQFATMVIIRSRSLNALLNRLLKFPTLREWYLGPGVWNGGGSWRGGSGGGGWVSGLLVSEGFLVRAIKRLSIGRVSLGSGLLLKPVLWPDRV